MKALLRGTLATLVGSISLFVASTALAEGEACYNDDDCPGTACGDAVCNWTKTSKMPMGEKGFYCNPAGTQTPVGKDGWCTTDDDCKCKALGAKCVAPYCTFTKPGDAPGGAAGSTGAGGTGTAGTTSTAGTATKPAEAESSGCSVSMPGSSNSALALGVGLVGLGFALARRRRS
ncbi:MAG TPA: MYXO-CTERM sorting domain-containing protein [Polyangiaceae bacterium]|nr:MYXO-CTERM sorting domain-containing protein [Polyangiaceae bacterium]